VQLGNKTEPTPSRSVASSALPPGREASPESFDAGPRIALDESLPDQATASRFKPEREDTTVNSSRHLPKPKKPAVRTHLAPSLFCAS
jgi:hypothetical protein